MKELEKQKDYEEKYILLRVAANSQKSIMLDKAKKNMEEEKEKNGLIIEKAIYYPKNDPQMKTEFVQDVTIPLQYFVNESKLELYLSSKSGLLGFYQVNDLDMVLYIRYIYNNDLYEITINDKDSIILPAYKALKMGNSKLIK